MIRSLLVPLDGSRFREQGLALASRLARASGANIHLARVHVHAPGLMVANSPFPMSGAREEIEQEEKYLNDLADRLADAGTPADASVLEGPRVAESLSSHAEDVDADLVLMASHGRSGLRRLWQGSVASDLVRRTELPVFVTRPAPDGAAPSPVDVRTLLVVLDGSASAEGVLVPAAELALTTGARMVLVHAAVSTWEYATEYLDEVASSLRERGIEVMTHPMFGRGTGAAIARVAAATSADVIAMATDGRGRFGGRLRGTVADDILRSTGLPLLLVRSLATA